MRPSRCSQGPPRRPRGLRRALGRVRTRPDGRPPRRRPRRPGPRRGSDRSGLAGAAVGRVRRSGGTGTRHRAVGRRGRRCRGDRTRPRRGAGVDDRLAGGVLGQPPRHRRRVPPDPAGGPRARRQARKACGPARAAALRARAGGAHPCGHHRRGTGVVAAAGLRTDRRGRPPRPGRRRGATATGADAAGRPVHPCPVLRGRGGGFRAQRRLLRAALRALPLLPAVPGLRAVAGGPRVGAPGVQCRGRVTAGRSLRRPVGRVPHHARRPGDRRCRLQQPRTPHRGDPLRGGRGADLHGRVRDGPRGAGRDLGGGGVRPAGARRRRRRGRQCRTPDRQRRRRRGPGRRGRRRSLLFPASTRPPPPWAGSSAPQRS